MKTKFKKLTKKETLGTIQSDFITLTSHQLRTPLSAMKWLLELLKEGDTANLTKKQKSYINKIYISNERMIALVNDLLEVTRLESGENKLMLQPIDLTTIIRSLIREKEMVIRKKRLKITFTVEREPFPLVRTEATKIKQAVGNIVNNAILYTPDNGNILVELKRQDGTVLGTVRDSGVGIPKDQQGQVFDKFFRGNNILSFETTGTGLGLFITKAFIEASGGKIWFNSEEGKGTTFYFTLPIAE
ncbi:MAG: HAMP domain-containing histidine kinase [Candidatus Doudnabacteria bacterium]|nr:HAMP domain-containing histidine kinase [Candidatus Doudnabacteria bacterium]